MDLAVIASLLSSHKDSPINSTICFAGEVGLNGEVRPIARIDHHIQEAERIGFKTIVISSYNQQDNKKFNIKVVKCSKVMDLYEFLSKL